MALPTSYMTGSFSKIPKQSLAFTKDNLFKVELLMLSESINKMILPDKVGVISGLHTVILCNIPTQSTMIIGTFVAKQIVSYVYTINEGSPLLYEPLFTQ